MYSLGISLPVLSFVSSLLQHIYFGLCLFSFPVSQSCSVGRVWWRNRWKRLVPNAALLRRCWLMLPTPTRKGCLCSRNAGRGPRSTRWPASARLREIEEGRQKERQEGRQKRKEGALSSVVQKLTKRDSQHRLTLRGIPVISTCWTGEALPARQPHQLLQQRLQPITIQGWTSQPIRVQDLGPLSIKAQGWRSQGRKAQPIRAQGWTAASRSSQSVTTLHTCLLQLLPWPMGGR